MLQARVLFTGLQVHHDCRMIIQDFQVPHDASKMSYSNIKSNYLLPYIENDAGQFCLLMQLFFSFWGFLGGLLGGQGS